MPKWPNISYSWVEKQVGRDGLGFLTTQLRAHLAVLDIGSGQLDFRLAPSIITRSEAEVLSLSSPRFSVRAMFGDGTFFNLRRMSKLATTSIVWHRPQGNEKDLCLDDKRANQLSPQDLLTRSAARCIADGLIVPSEALKKDYFLVETNLFHAYGEMVVNKTPPNAIPFVQSLQLSGGLCAQAVCFMANSALSEYCSGIHGLGEISAISLSLEAKNEAELLPIGGLTPDKICAYFNSKIVGLSSALCHSGVYKELMPNDGVDRPWFHKYVCKSSISSYIASGFPVICLVDVRNLRKFHDRHGLSFPQLDETKPALHAMLAVGVNRSGFQEEVLVNDPSNLPLMKVGFDELQSASPLGDQIAFAPVLPSPVKLHLQETRLPYASLGLIRMFAFIARTAGQAKHTSTAVGRCFASDGNGFTMPGQFLLVGPRNVRRLQGILPREIVDYVQHHSPTEWNWIQIRPTSEGYGIIAWDATRVAKPIDALNLHRATSFITAAWFREKGSSDWLACDNNPKTFANNKKPRECTPAADQQKREILLQRSIISSFPCARLSMALKLLAKHRRSKRIQSVDFYMAMEGEEFLHSNLQTVEHLLAAGCHDEFLIKRLADHIVNLLQSKQFECKSFATFFPSLSLHPQHDLAKQSRNALLTTCRVAEEFCKRIGNKLVIEIVGGSSVEGLYPATFQTNGENVAVVGVQPKEDCIKNLLENLTILAQDLTPVNTRLALELEPGPLFTINSRRSLLLLCKHLQDEKHALLRDFLGLNLDISHYRLAKISPRIFRRSDALRKMIFHAHIAGHHHCAHFGDIPPLLLNTRNDFSEWLQLLEQLREESPNFTGCLSLELEAAQSTASLDLAIRDFVTLLN